MNKEFLHLPEMVHYVTSWRRPVPAGRGTTHSHEACEMVYHESGQGTVLPQDREAIGFVEHGVEIMPLGLTHTQYQHEAGTDCCVQFRLNNTDARRRWCASPLSVKLSADEYPAAELAALSILPRPRDVIEQQIYDCRVTAVLLQLLMRTAVTAGVNPTLSRAAQLARDAHEFVRIHWRDIRHIQQVAEELNVSPDYLRHVFHDHYGITVHDLITQMRVDHAKDLLLNSDLPQKAMAEVCGFADIQQFSRRFRQITGMAPGRYRRSQCAG